MRVRSRAKPAISGSPDSLTFGLWTPAGDHSDQARRNYGILWPAGGRTPLHVFRMRGSSARLHPQRDKLCAPPRSASECRPRRSNGSRRSSPRSRAEPSPRSSSRRSRSSSSSSSLPSSAPSLSTCLERRRRTALTHPRAQGRATRSVSLRSLATASTAVCDTEGRWAGPRRAAARQRRPGTRPCSKGCTRSNKASWLSRQARWPTCRWKGPQAAPAPCPLPGCHL